MTSLTGHFQSFFFFFFFFRPPNPRSEKISHKSTNKKILALALYLCLLHAEYKYSS